MSTPITAKNVDLSNCDRELIQFPGAVLPHGFLLTVQEPELKILQVSLNAGSVFGREPRALLGLSLEELLGVEKVQEIRSKSSWTR
jgi:chemotaxis family two-component system sensor kinase Cph1